MRYVLLSATGAPARSSAGIPADIVLASIILVLLLVLVAVVATWQYYRVRRERNASTRQRD